MWMFIFDSQPSKKTASFPSFVDGKWPLCTSLFSAFGDLLKRQKKRDVTSYHLYNKIKTETTKLYSAIMKEAEIKALGFFFLDDGWKYF